MLGRHTWANFMGEIDVTEEWDNVLRGLGVDLEGLCQEDIELVKKTVYQFKKIMPHSEVEKEVVKQVILGTLGAVKEKVDQGGADGAFHEIAGDATFELENIFGASKKDGTDFSNIQHIQYKRTGNPLHAWLALTGEMSRSQLSGWLKDYLEAIAFSLIKMSVKVANGEDVPEGAKFNKELVEILGFEGKVQFRELSKWLANVDAAWTLDGVLEMMSRGEIETTPGQRGKDTSAIIAGKMFHKDGRTVEKMAKKGREVQKHVRDAIRSQRNDDGPNDE